MYVLKAKPNDAKKIQKKLMKKMLGNYTTSDAINARDMSLLGLYITPPFNGWTIIKFDKINKSADEFSYAEKFAQLIPKYIKTDQLIMLSCELYTKASLVAVFDKKGKKVSERQFATSEKLTLHISATYGFNINEVYENLMKRVNGEQYRIKAKLSIYNNMFKNYFPKLNPLKCGRLIEQIWWNPGEKT